MNLIAREYLVRIIRRYGKQLHDDPQRLRGLLADYCGKHRKEINVLVSAATECIPASLISTNGSEPPATVFSRLAQQLQEDLGFSKNAAEWAVESWAVALEVTLPELERQRIVCPACATSYRVQVPKSRHRFQCKICSSEFRHDGNESIAIVKLADLRRVHLHPPQSDTPSKVTVSNCGNATETQIAHPEEYSRMQYRDAVRMALSDGILEDSEISLLNEIRERLCLTTETAMRIYQDVAAAIPPSTLPDPPPVASKIPAIPPTRCQHTISTDDDSSNQLPMDFVTQQVWQFLSSITLRNDCFRSPHIPQGKLDNLANRSCFSTKDVAFLLIDCTLLGSAKNGVLFGGRGIYWHNAWQSKKPGPGFLSYPEIVGEVIFADGYELLIGSHNSIHLSGSQVSCVDLRDLLGRLKGVVRQALII